MPKNQPEKKLEVKARTIKLLASPARRVSRKVDSLIETHYEGSCKFPNQSVHALFEMKISCDMLKEYLEDLLEQMRESEVESVFLAPQEVQAISSLAKAVEMASAAPIHSTNLLEH